MVGTKETEGIVETVKNFNQVVTMVRRFPDEGADILGAIGLNLTTLGIVPALRG